MGRFIDEVGNKYGRLTVISRAENNKHGKAMWNCICDCGKETAVIGCDLRNKRTLSCGCLNREIVSKRYKGKTRPNMTRENNPNWNSNLTEEHRMGGRNIPGYKEWHSEVFERDNYTCQVCGKVGGNLVTHHIEAYNSNPELRTVVSNGITMCEDCHKDFHHQFGMGDNTRSQLIKFRKKEKQLCLQKVEQMQQLK